MDSEPATTMDQELFNSAWYRLAANLDKVKHNSADYESMETIRRLMCALSFSIEGLCKDVKEKEEKPKDEQKSVEIFCGDMNPEEAIEEIDDQSLEEKQKSENPNLVARKGEIQFPKADDWRKNEEFNAKLLSSASPLEFVVITEANQRILHELNKKFERRFNRLLKSPIPRERCYPEMPCLLLHNNTKLHRALIKAVGFEDVHVKLVDSGRTLFSSFENVFDIPSRFVRHAPPLATACFLAGGDSRYMEADFVDNFNEIVSRVSLLRVTASGVRHPRSGHPIVTLQSAETGEAIQCYNKNKTN